MTRVQRATTWGLSAIRRYAAEHGAIPSGDQIQDGWFEPHPSGIELDFSMAHTAAEAAGSRDDGSGDFDLAVAVHDRWKLPRAIAAENRVWPWVAIVPFGAYTATRWRDAKRNLGLRVGAQLRDNAIARLWWSAEFAVLSNAAEVRARLRLPAAAGGRYAFAERLLQAATERSIGRRKIVMVRALTVAILAYVESEKLISNDVEQLAKAVGLATSSICPEYFDCGVDGDPYRLDLDAVAELYETVASIDREVEREVKRKSGLLGFIKSLGKRG